ncbi:uncharacterized protein RCC_03147 [Ramularia collo-cygni]|uniref:Uncharacterized protein n=1 Tax=Ramularia collo-cygni TaxID=112498 RepID=A0A2D3VA60_9PEZI|nr:uncharacterized protein RCC_03147 [Ramularia collo-cygni]CZT17313.1 uncharacterized protein RCC_03147 [Ramularia collo-cygni]
MISPPFARPGTAASAVKALKVFSTPGLLEGILLSGVSTQTILDTMRVKRDWKDTILASGKLKRYLGLGVGLAGSFYYSPWSNADAPLQFNHQLARECDKVFRFVLPGGGLMRESFPCYNPEHTHTHQDLITNDNPDARYFYHSAMDLTTRDKTVFINIYFTPEDSLDFGSRIQSMAISSPAPRSMKVRMWCERCSKISPEAPDVRVLTRNLGVTIGMLASTAKELREEYPKCQRCPFGPPMVWFSGEVPMQVPDPLREPQDQEGQWKWSVSNWGDRYERAEKMTAEGRARLLARPWVNDWDGLDQQQTPARI